MAQVYPAVAWLNPSTEEHWGYSSSTQIIRSILNDRMYPLTLHGLEDAMRALTRKN
jgi:uncharacterized protein with von Willebrand factor type A (vWA) domain